MPRKSKDLLDELVAERTERNPHFPDLVRAALEQRGLIRALVESREGAGLTQTQVAARMQTSQSAVARLESAEGDLKLSTLARYAAAVGKRIKWQVDEPAEG